MKDLEFVQRCVVGDKRAWDEFVDKYSRLIYNYIHSVIKTKGVSFSQENINDLFQEIFLALARDNFKKLGTFKGKNGCSLASWLRQVTINASIDYLKKLRPAFSIEEENADGLALKDILSDNALSASDTLLEKERLSNLKNCIARLNSDEKYFLELHIHRGIRLEELKRIFKLSRSGIDMRKSRIIEKLRECFKSKGFIL